MTGPTRLKRPAVFLDRDGTLIEDTSYISKPSDVHLVPGAAEAVWRLEQAGYLRIIITNQSGIGRGLFTEADFSLVQREVETQLDRSHRARLNATYHCPHREEDGCECRKPGLLMFQQAVKSFDIDLASSWCVGDRLSDLLPARALGMHACLLLTGEGHHHQVQAEQDGFHVEADLLQAVTRRILGE